MDALREAADRLGVLVVERPPLTGSMSGSVVVAGLTDRHGNVVLKVTGHTNQEATAAAGREVAAYTELSGTGFLPELVSSAVTSDWTAVVLRRYVPMPPADRWAEEDWLDLAARLAELHERGTPTDSKRWEWPSWRGLDPAADRAALERLWCTPETAAALDWAIASRAELVAASEPLPASLVHGDCHTGNVLRADAGLLLCDWQSARIAPGSNDIAFLLTRAIPTGAEPPPARILAHYCALRGLPLDDVADAVRAEQVLVLAFQYPAFADYLDATAVERLGRAFVQMVGQP